MKLSLLILFYLITTIGVSQQPKEKTIRLHGAHSTKVFKYETDSLILYLGNKDCDKYLQKISKNNTLEKYIISLKEQLDSMFLFKDTISNYSIQEKLKRFEVLYYPLSKGRAAVYNKIDRIFEKQIRSSIISSRSETSITTYQELRDSKRNSLIDSKLISITDLVKFL